MNGIQARFDALLDLIAARTLSTAVKAPLKGGCTCIA